MFRRVLMSALFTILVAAAGGMAPAASAGNEPAQALLGTVAAPPCPHRGGHPVLSEGSQGPAVEHLQCLLRREWGYAAVEEDGKFGPITRSAVIFHQHDCHIREDGIVGEVTWNRLHRDTSTRECLDRGRD